MNAVVTCRQAIGNAAYSEAGAAALQAIDATAVAEGRPSLLATPEHAEKLASLIVCFSRHFPDRPFCDAIRHAHAWLCAAIAGEEF